MVQPEAVEFQEAATLERVKTYIPNPSMNGEGYFDGQCVHAVAIWRAQLGIPVGQDWHNASDWLAAAQSAGIQILSYPVKDAIVYFPPSLAGGLGHVALTTEVYPDGSFQIREMNWQGPFVEDTRVLKNDGSYRFIYY